MRRLALIATLLVGTATVFASSATGDSEHTYFIEMDNAFGLVQGSEVKVGGVTQGTITDLFINADKKAVVKVVLDGDLAALGTDSTCNSEPQSLIAEYFLDCTPKGPAIDESGGSDSERAANPDIPADHVFQTVQNDLAQSGLREPFKRRLQLVINEFGTALAGNPEELNKAILRGAPALRELRKVLRILEDQNTLLRQLNVDSDTVFVELAQRRKDVVKFIKNARATAEASAERRDDLSTNFQLLDDFLIELRPSLADLRELATEQTPLLTDLNASAPGLATLSGNLPDFNDASAESLSALGEASVIGRRALRKGADEVKTLGRASRKADTTADYLADFLADLDDPRRVVQIDERAGDETGRTSSKPGTKNTMGYTGLEGLLNYVYYQAGALNQFDEVSHLLHFSIFEIEDGPCIHHSTGGEPGTPEFGYPDASGAGHTTNVLEANRCVSVLGDSQPRITEPQQDFVKYHPSVCPDGSSAPEICDPSDPARGPARKRRPGGGDISEIRGSGGGSGGGGSGGGTTRPGLDDVGSLPKGTPALPGGLDDLLDIPGARGKVGGATRGVLRGQSAERNLMSFLLDN